MPHIPTAKQAAFMLLCCMEAYFGGAGGGGKSDALLMDALQYVDVPGYSAILFRATYTNLAQAGAIMDRAQEWLIGKPGVRWSGSDKRFIFTTSDPQKPATLSFGYLQNDLDHLKYNSAEFQYIGFDEVTEIRERSYRYLFARLRRQKGCNIPLKCRSTSNPAQNWVKARFVNPGTPEIPFIKSTVYDNPYLDVVAYVESLQHLHPTDKARILNGDWDVTEMGDVFKRDWFLAPGVILQQPPDDILRTVRIWDLATTEKTKADYTAGGLYGLRQNRSMICLDMRRYQQEYPAIKQHIKAVAQTDGRYVPIGIEAVAGFKAVAQDLAAELGADGYTVIPINQSKDKFTNSLPVQALVRNGMFHILSGLWNNEFIQELVEFRGDGKTNDDQGDTAFMAHRIFFEPSDSRFVGGLPITGNFSKGKKERGVDFG